MNSMKVAFVSVEDPRDVHAWSGLVYRISQALEPYAQIAYAGPLAHKRFLSDKLRQVVCEAVSGKHHRRGREAWLLKYQAEQARPRVAAADPDIVFACSTLPIAYLECLAPMAVWIDATFAGLVNYYPEYKNLCHHAVTMGNAAEQRALDRCRWVFFASEWAARTAVQAYDLGEEKIAVVPFGANLEAPAGTKVATAARQRSTEVCRLLLVGVDWERKGADLAVDATMALRSAGVPAELTIVGCVPPAGTRLPDCVRLAGFISQATDEGRAQVAQLYRQTHFLLLPSRAECYGVVVAESNSFGVPVLASSTGGIPVTAGVNGTKVDRFVPESVAYIAAHWTNPARYLALAESSRQEFDTRLNWQVAGRKVAEILGGCAGSCGRRAAQGLRTEA